MICAIQFFLFNNSLSKVTHFTSIRYPRYVMYSTLKKDFFDKSFFFFELPKEITSIKIKVLKNKLLTEIPKVLNYKRY